LCIDPVARLGAVAFYGDVMGPELVAAIEALFGDEGWEPGFDALWDGRGVANLIVGPEDIDAVVAANDRLLDRIGEGHAVILTTGAEEYASAFMIRRQLGPTTGKQIRLADNLLEAMALLDIRELPESIETLLEAHLPRHDE